MHTPDFLPLLSEIPFAAYLQYAPRGTSPKALEAKQFPMAFKNCQPNIMRGFFPHLAREYFAAGLSEFVGPNAALVPMPRSAPLVPNGLWPAREICIAMRKAGLGSEVLTIISRKKPVPKSAFAKAADRPTALTHRESFGIDTSLGLLAPENITLVDDVCTKGATFMGAASLIHAHFPHSTIRAFAIIRTMSFVEDIDAYIAPCVGRITYNPSNGTTFRAP